MKSILIILMTVLIVLQGCKNNEDTESLDNTLPEVSLVAKNINNYLRYMESLGFSGAIVVNHKGEKILSEGYGFADRKNKIRFTPQTVQSNGSNTKQFTGASILLLESQNKLSVNDSLPVYFDNIPKDKQQITLHQLLTHSSGLIQGVGDDKEPMEFETFFNKLMSEPLRFEPGNAYNYSNAGYSILGRIVEKVSGKNYESFLKEFLLEPLGMNKTGYILPKWESEEMAIGYEKGKQWGKVYKRGWIDDGPNWHLRANGGLHTTAEDMHKWLQNVKGNGVLNSEAVEKWTTGYITEDNSYSKYGYGLVSYVDDKWGKVISHSGSNGIFTSHFFWLPNSDFFFYIHGNTSIFPTYKLEYDILRAGFDKTFNFPPVIKTYSPDNKTILERKEGVYKSKIGTIELMTDGPRLIAKFSGQKTLDLMFNYNDEQKEKVSKLNATAKKIMKKLENGDEDAFERIRTEKSDSKSVTQSFLNRIINMRRNLESLNVIGTFENSPGSQFYEYGAYTTFVHARFENWNQYWNLIWKEDGTYSGMSGGPWPELTLVPVGKNQYKGLRGTQPWITVDVKYDNDCLIIENEKFCFLPTE
ncbi:serine hydrolase [Ascidiimonas aurantiaca]|uniref:serine hydrolase n=1 Tax=Ascidiimonas aurantiaca TaxID=1685432 RepID=UPI0030EC6CD6